MNYVLRGGELFNMVLLVPDDMPLDGANTLAGDVEEMRALYKDWGRSTTTLNAGDGRMLTTNLQTLASPNSLRSVNRSTSGDCA